MVDRVFQSTTAVLTLAFLASGLIALCNGHTTVTAFDMWHLDEVLINQPFLHAAALKYGSHSIFFPSLIWLTDIAVFRNNQQLLFLIGLTFLILSALLLAMAVWQDTTTGTTGKLIATLVIVVANFSMARASITSIGAFNCICSLVVLGAIVAFHSLLLICRGTRFFWPTISLLVTFGLVSSFSFGSGFGVWPTLLLLAWSSRLSWRNMSIILAAGIIAVVIYAILPGAAAHISPGDAISIGTALSRLCNLIGAPFLYATAAWSSRALSPAAALSSRIPFVCGILGVALAAMAILPRLVRRDVGRSTLQFIALAFTIFNFIAIGFIVVGRTAQMHVVPGEILAPRYLFWSFLFWMGLCLLLVQKVESKNFIRWPAWVVLLALPILAFPQHYKGAMWSKTVELLMESAATGLINGVCDADKVKVMYPDPTTVYRLAKQFRRQRLDMFADGVQDWIGVPETNLAGGVYRRTDLEGVIAIQALVQCKEGKPAARVTGWAMEERKCIPEKLVFVDPTGTVCGLARPTERLPLINQRYKLNWRTANGFLGYIPNYNPGITYRARTVDRGGLSKGTLFVRPLPPVPGTK